MTPEDQKRVRDVLKYMKQSSQLIIALRDQDVYVTDVVTKLIVAAAELGLQEMETWGDRN